MSAKRSTFLALALFVATVFMGGIMASTATAYSSYSTYTMPSISVSSYAYAFAHGDGSATIGDGDCPGYEANPSSTANSAVTLSSSGSSIDAVKKIRSGMQTQACLDWVAAGADGTLFAVQVGPSSSSYPYQIVAARDNTVLWTQSFPDPAGCSGRTAHILDPTLGLDGNLYMHLDWTYLSSSCPEKEALVSLSTANGAVNFTQSLPNVGQQYLDPSVWTIMPFDGGVAVLNGSTTSFSVLFYDDSGSALTSDNWTPTLSGASVKLIKIDPATGRIFLITQKYNTMTFTYDYALYFKDTSSSTVTQVTLPSGAGVSDVFAAPSGDFVASWGISSTNKGFSYYNSSGTQLYQANVYTETGAYVSSLQNGWITVDDGGNVIIRKQIDDTVGDSDRNVVVDSYDSSGTKTRLFNSSQMATGSLDSFTSTSSLYQAVGGGKLYMVLCHATGSYTTDCTSSYSPEVVALTVPGTYDYAREAAFNNELTSTVNYVALGDSYSSGESVSPFMPGTDNNGGDGCDRSFSAYPVQLTGLDSALRLRAFRACSGATSPSVASGTHGETNQLDSLNSDTQLVTITIGGNDIDFASFAEECWNPLGSCDTSSTQYMNSMYVITNELPTDLHTLFDAIAAYAPNASVMVVGYPDLAPPTGTSCSVWTFSNSEEDAVHSLTDALNSAISDAVTTEGGNFTFVDPTETGSPFIGHELCTSDPYFTGPSTPLVFSFHPTIDGQNAYASLIYSHL